MINLELMMRNHNPAKECSIRNSNQQINAENVFFSNGLSQKNTAKRLTARLLCTSQVQ